MAERMKCPQCGVPTTLHAEKLLYTDASSDASSPLGGQIEEMHSYPVAERKPEWLTTTKRIESELQTSCFWPQLGHSPALVTFSAAAILIAGDLTL